MSAIRVPNQLMPIIAILVLITGASCVPASIRSQPTEPQPTVSQPTLSQPTFTPTVEIPTPTLQPTETSVPPTETALPTTEEPEVESLEIAVPPGIGAIVDGVLSPDEWETAIQIDLDDEIQLFLMQAGGYLYLGMRGKPEPVTSICVDQGEQVSILHSSAAIGTAVYQLGDGVWEQVRDFEWCCRETTASPQAQEALSNHLQEEGWIANNGRLGVPEEVEFQIALPDNSLRLVVNSIGPPYYRSVLSWPDDLEDDCSSLDMITCSIPEQAQFSLEQWITLSISPD